MTARGTASRFLQGVLHNGVGREYIEEGVIDFARQNPGIVLYVTEKKCHVPKLVGEYLNGAVREESLSSKTAREVAQLIQKMATQSGLDKIRIRKPYHTDSPSVQGQWNPFINKPTALNLQDFKKD
ncbi:39S ribosomal protein L43, mitochondrial isoform X2 [Pristis pectinata]|uniref:39S ribosomal protein L43, mitochondrial isoform X2 n=1 Tax=Pristis pectinata TaxID=685728 RepID=UPI00223E8D5B|nr:39S ribosomal protein L43, mitochondrial isoform X2 [Pristis pectinata]